MANKVANRELNCGRDIYRASLPCSAASKIIAAKAAVFGSMIWKFL